MTERCGPPGRQGFTLVELMIVTVIIGLLAMIVSTPLNRARQNAMVTTAKVELRHVMTAIELYTATTGVLPGSIEILIEVGHSPANDIAYCRFQVADGGAPADSHVMLEAQHIATKTRVRTRYPGHSGFEEVPAGDICADLAEPVAGPPGRRVRRGWDR